MARPSVSYQRDSFIKRSVILFTISNKGNVPVIVGDEVWRYRRLANGVGRLAQALSVFAGLLLTVLVGALPSAARPLDAIKADGTLKVGMTGDYAPFSFRSSNGRVSG